MPHGFSKCYDAEKEVLKLNVPMYGTKQAVHCFYKLLVSKVKERNFELSKAVPCLFFCWKDDQLVIMVS